MDTTGLWLMSNGVENNLLCSNLPMMNDDTKIFTESDYFDNIIKPSLVNRFPMCTNAKVLNIKFFAHFYTHLGNFQSYIFGL